jgi:hypothetical protein
MRNDSRLTRNDSRLTAAEVSVKIEDFGRDHWSAFAYIEVRIVDHNGVARREHLRCIHKRH